MNVHSVNAVKVAAPAPAQKPNKYVAGCVRKGRIAHPDRIFMYGKEGIGKSTFAAGADSPIWLGRDAGTGHLRVARLPQPETWEDVLNALRYLQGGGEPEAKTLVVDPLGWFEPLLFVRVCADKGLASIDQPNKFGAGYTAAVDYWRVFLSEIERLQSTRGMNVILIAHATKATEKSPDIEDYDRHVPEMHKKSAAVLQQWADYVLFARQKIWTTKGADNRIRGASDGARIMQTQELAGYDAKSRPALPNPLPLSWRSFTEAREVEAKRINDLREQLDALLKALAYVNENSEDIVERLEEVINVFSVEVEKKGKKEAET